MIMGLAASGVKLGAVGMLGRQHLDLTDPAWATNAEARLGLKVLDLITQRDDVYAEPFFERLGASSVDSVDFSDYQGANTIHDMNDPLPAALERKFHLLHDGGTMEHVFHVPNYLANCMKLLKVGGFYVGVVPADNWLGHGFYQFSPELVTQVFCESNGFRLRAHGLGSWGRKRRVFNIPDTSLWKGRMEPRLGEWTLLLIIAEKVADVVPFAKGWPQQSDYAFRWDVHAANTGAAASAVGRPSWKRRVGSLLPSSLKQLVEHELIRRRHRRERNAQITEVGSADKLLRL